MQSYYFSDRDKAKCVMLLCELKTVISVQRSFRICYNKEPTHISNFHRCCKQFADPESVKSKLDQVDEKLKNLFIKI